MSEDTRGLAYDVPVGAWFFQAVQEMLSGGAIQFQLTYSGHTITVPAGPGDAQASISITGLYRWITSPASVPVSGTAGEYDIYATAATANSYVSNADATNRTFGLATVAHGASAPGSVHAARLVGNCQFDGTNIVALTQTVPPTPTSPSSSIVKTWADTRSYTLPDDTIPSSTALLVARFPIKILPGQTATLYGADHLCSVRGGTASVFQVQTDTATHGTLAAVSGLTALSPTIGAYVEVPASAPVALNNGDQVAILATTPGNSKGVSVAPTIIYTD